MSNSSASLPEDKLERLFAMQRSLNAYVFRNNDLGMKYDDIPNDPAQQNQWVQNYVLAMRQELGELMDSTNWKWWRTRVDLFDGQNICVELVDILHFWISACQVMGLEAADVMRMYEAKNQVNFERQHSGYLEKNENDSRHIV